MVMAGEELTFIVTFSELFRFDKLLQSCGARGGGSSREATRQLFDNTSPHAMLRVLLSEFVTRSSTI
jgi:hypothetical protein